MNFLKNRVFVHLLLAATTALFLSGCGGSGGSSETEKGLIKVKLQTDWYAQPEHGGFYQALVKGYYREAGLDVEIIPGGPNALPVQKAAQGVVQFAMGRSDEVIIAASRKVPLVILGALMQHDPQAILFHKESGIKDFKDLDGKTIMATPGSAFIRIMERTYDIDVNVMPLDYGMNRFLADKNFIQQCFITNEPYYVTKEGANPGTLLLAESGFSPYRVWYTSSGFARAKPEVVKAFTKASIRGWNDYLTGDRTEANAMIAERNPQQTEEFMAYVINSMIENKLVTGDPAKGERTGLITKERIQTQIEQLKDIDMLESDVSVDDVLMPELLEVSAAPPAFNTDSPNLVLKTHHPDSILTRSITPAQMASISKPVKKKFFETQDEVYDMTVVYLADFIDKFLDKSESNFWIMNCGDGYQSNFDTEIIERNRPFFVISMNGKPIVDWLEELGHPEWGPHVVNIESNEGLLDPGHKNPWGVFELHATTREMALEPWGAGNFSSLQIRGRDRVLNSCASCHQSGNGLLGGQVSTRTFQMLATFATTAESHFRNMLIDPVKTNPLAAKMP
ncbi:MAG: ABC transporter substrate-binding protein, partial [Verrucomicrobiae bacterium]|nr:ABC transporter substrate-binding protein [Verrucomicrobiae bacterium]